MSYIPAHRDAADDPLLRGAPLAVYSWLLYRLEVHTYTQIKVTGLAYALHMKRDTVIRALKILTAEGYLQRGPASDGRRTYRLCQNRTRPIVPPNGHSGNAA